MGRGARVADGRDRSYLPARGPHSRAPGLPGLHARVAKNVMARACKTAGIVHRHPHDLRHRYASVQIARGVPVTQVAAQLGHSRKSLTLDTYSHVPMGD